MTEDRFLDTFRKVTGLLPEPVFLLGADTRVLVANPAAHRLIGGLGAGPPLHELVSEGAPAVERLVRRWLRSGDPTPAGLTLRGDNGERVRSRCYGARADWAPPGRPMVHMRALRLDSGDRFVGLREQVLGLKRERAQIYRSGQTQRELTAALEAAEQALDRSAAFSLALAEACTTAQIADLVAGRVPDVLGCAAALLAVLTATPSSDAAALELTGLDELPQAAASRSGAFARPGSEVGWTPLRRGRATLGALVTAASGAPPLPRLAADRARRLRESVAAQLTQALLLADPRITERGPPRRNEWPQKV